MFFLAVPFVRSKSDKRSRFSILCHMASALECSGVRLMIEMSGLESYNEVKNYVQAY